MPAPNTDTTYIALAENYWGKGFSIDTAKSTCRCAGNPPLVVKKLPIGAYNVHVDEMGNICWNEIESTGEKCETVWESREYKRRKKSA